MNRKPVSNRINLYLRDRRILILLFLLIITPLGLFSKAYAGIGQEWVQDYSGDVLYEIFWCLVVFWFVPTIKDLNRLFIWAIQELLDFLLIQIQSEVSNRTTGNQYL